MNKKFYYILTILLLFLGINSILDFFIVSTITVCLIFKFKTDDFFLLIFPLLIFEQLLAVPYLNCSIFRIYELIFAVRVLYDLKYKKNIINFDKRLIVISLFFILTSILYSDLKYFISIVINVFMIFYISSTKYNDKEFFNKLFYVIGLFSASSVFYGILHNNALAYGSFNRLYFTIPDPNYSSLFLNIGFFSLLGTDISNKYERLFLQFFCILGILLTISLSGILFFLILFMIYLLIENKKLLKKLILIFIILFVIFLIMPLSTDSFLFGLRSRLFMLNELDFDTMTSYRFSLALNYLNHFFKLPVFNILFGGINYINGSAREQFIAMFGYVSHNSYVDVVYMMGIFGLGILIYLFIKQIVSYYKAYKNNLECQYLILFLIKLMILFYCFSISIFPFRYFIFYFILNINTKKTEKNIKILESKKRILWIVNTIFPFPAKMLNYKPTVLGGWLNSLFNKICNDDNIQIAVATTYSGKNIRTFQDKDTIYYLIPCNNPIIYDEKTEKYFSLINHEFKPNLTHIHGTEFPIGLSYINSNNRSKVVTSIQGLATKISEVYLSGIEKNEIYNNLTFRDIIKRDNILDQQRKFIKRGIYEKEIIEKSDNIIGRTHWDYRETLKIAKKDKYFKCNECLRDEFYLDKWDLNKCQKHSIYISQASYPIKGFHVMLKALNDLVKMYPNIILYVSGENILKQVTLIEKIKFSGYARYIKGLIKKYNLTNNICFLGYTDSKKTCEYMLKANVYVQASSIENSPNGLGEAMILGLPVVASRVGGTSSLLKHNEEGLLYKFGDYKKLICYIKKIFDNPVLANTLSKNSILKATEIYDRDKNSKKILEIYNEIIETE